MDVLMEYGKEHAISTVKWDTDSSAPCPLLPQTKDLLKLQLCQIIVSHRRHMIVHVRMYMYIVYWEGVARQC